MQIESIVYHINLVVSKLKNVVTTSNEEGNVSKLVKEIFEILVKSYSLEKVFSRWIGKSDWKGGTEEKIKRIAEKILKEGEKKEGLQSLIEVLSEEAKIFEKAEKLVCEQYPHLKDIPLDYLEKSWRKNYKTILQTINLIKNLKAIEVENEAEEAEVNSLRDKLNVWCLHYLVRGAKMPILPPAIPSNLPFVDSIYDNEPLYYRGDGGAIINLYFEQLYRHYPFLKDKFILEIIKNSHFPMLIEKCAAKNNFDYLKFSEEEIPKDSGHVFIDVSTELLRFDLVEEKVKFIEEQYEQFQKEKDKDTFVTIGGSLSINHQELFFCYPKSKRGKALRDDFKNFRGAMGFFPEMMSLKYRLVDLGFSLEDLRQKFPFAIEDSFSNDKEFPPLSKEEIAEQWVQLKNFLNDLSSKSFLSELGREYLGLLSSLVQGMSPEVSLEKGLVYQEVGRGIENLRKNLEKIEALESSLEASKIKFKRGLERYYLLFEWIAYLLVFFKMPSLNKKHLCEVFNTLSEHTNSEVCKRSFSHTSGMSTFGSIVDALTAIYGREQNINALLMKGSYYEIFEAGGLKEYMGSCYEFLGDEDGNSIFEAGFLLNDSDVLFTDLHPNFVTLPSVSSIPVKELALGALRERKRQSPFTLVLDTSTTLFFHSEVKALIEDKELTQAVEEGRLIIVVTSGLAKFFLCGLDKYTGGIIQTYTGKAYEERFNDFIKTLSYRQDLDVFSDEALKFFSLLGMHCKDNIISYFNTFRRKTHEFYKRLAELTNESNPLRVGEREENIVMLGLHFDYILQIIMEGQKEEEEESENIKKNLTFLMQYYLYGQLVKQGYPIFIRSSFGFPSTTLIECATALRLTIGKEEDELHGRYAQSIRHINEEIKHYLESLKEDREAVLTSLKDYLNKSSEVFQQEIYNVQATFIRATQNNFKSFIEELIKSNS